MRVTVTSTSNTVVLTTRLTPSAPHNTVVGGVNATTTVTVHGLGSTLPAASIVAMEMVVGAAVSSDPIAISEYALPSRCSG